MQNTKQRGFSLIELLIVISVISVLATIGAISFQNAQRASRDAQRKNDLKVVQYALIEWEQDNPSGLFSSLDGSSNNFAGLITTLNGNQYLRNTIQDPRNVAPYIYTYTPDDTNDTFTLSACLENRNDQQGQVTTGSECGGAGNRKFVVTKP